MAASRRDGARLPSLTGIGNNTGIEVPPEHITQLDSGTRPAVVVQVNGYVYRNTVAVMGGTYMISVSAAVRKETGPQPAARAFFDALASSIRRFHIDNVNATKNPETRRRRVDAAVQKFLDGKQRSRSSSESVLRERRGLFTRAKCRGRARRAARGRRCARGTGECPRVVRGCGRRPRRLSRRRTG
jgi:hypothetical protein